MTPTSVLALLGFLFGGGIVIGMVKLAMTFGLWRQELTETGRRISRLEADAIDAEQAQEDGDAKVTRAIGEAMLAKSASHAELHNKIDGVERHVGRVETDLAKLQTRCDWINGPPSGPHPTHDTIKED